VGTATDPAAGNRERKENPFTDTLRRTAALLSLSAYMLEYYIPPHVSTAVTVWPHPALQASPTNTQN